jgi:hypothetical protein
MDSDLELGAELELYAIRRLSVGEQSKLLTRAEKLANHRNLRKSTLHRRHVL